MSFDAAPYLRRVARGDEAALAVIYAQFGGPVYSLALRVLGDSALAQEVTQDVFLKVWTNPSAWDANKGQFSSWLLTLTRYTAIDRIRREIRRTGKDVELDENVETQVDDQSDTPDRLHSLMLHLPKEQREVVELAYFRGLKHTELAERLGLPLGTVKTRLRLGLHKLKGLLGADGDPDGDSEFAR